MTNPFAWFAEVLETLQRHPLRTVLTAGSVAWGVFMLVVLLGVGNGLQNAMAWNFRDDATNSIWVYPGETSKPYAGFREGRDIRLRNGDYDALRGRVEEIDRISSRFYLRDATVLYEGRTGPFEIRSVHPDHRFLEQTLIARGRFLTSEDLAEERKVAVIGEEVSRTLFRGEEPIGEWIQVGGVSFRVVGTFTDVGGVSEMRKVYIPITTAQALFGGEDRVNQVLFTVGDAGIEEAAAIEAEVRALFASRHRYDPSDASAVRVRNVIERYQRVTGTFAMMDSFLLIAGIGTVLSGIVGVSNIMLVSVAERRVEIGLRKALGAVPTDIVGTIVGEAVLLTSISGYAGLVAGVGVVELIRQYAPDNEYVRDPSVDLAVIVGAIVLLVASGALAGFLPAWRAASVHPARALVDG